VKPGQDRPGLGGEGLPGGGVGWVAEDPLGKRLALDVGQNEAVLERGQHPGHRDAGLRRHTENRSLRLQAGVDAVSRRDALRNASPAV
jgi:hypothetical protein